MPFELKTTQTETQRVRVPPAFDQWILKKDRLDRGCTILSKLGADDLSVRTDDEKSENLGDFILACATIDGSLQRNESLRKDRSMKRALFTWLTTNYTYSDLLVEQKIYQQFSHDAKNMMFVEEEDGIYKMSSCCYHKEKEMSNKDRRLENGIFLDESNRHWTEALRTLHGRCLDQFATIAEAKVNDEETKSCELKTQVHSRDAKMRGRNDEFKEKAWSVKASTNLPSGNGFLLNAKTYGVSNERFQNFLAFGITYLSKLEQEKEQKKRQEADQDRLGKEIEAKKAHEQWLKKKDRDRQKAKEQTKELEQDDKSYIDRRLETQNEVQNAIKRKVFYSHERLCLSAKRALKASTGLVSGEEKNKLLIETGKALKIIDDRLFQQWLDWSGCDTITSKILWQFFEPRSCDTCTIRIDKSTAKRTCQFKNTCLLTHYTRSKACPGKSDRIQVLEKYGLLKVGLSTEIESDCTGICQVAQWNLEDDNLLYSRREEALAVLNTIAKKTRDDEKIATNALSPKIWMEQIMPSSECSVVIQWRECSDESVDSFLIAMGEDTEENILQRPVATFRDPLNNEGHGPTMKKKFHLRPGAKYWFSVRSSNSRGISAPSRILVQSIPPPPSLPFLIEESERSLTVGWSSADDNYRIKNRIFAIELCVNDEEGEWCRVWEGATSLGTIHGLYEGTSYKLRVQRLSNDLSLTGKEGVFHTQLKCTKQLEVICIGIDFCDMKWGECCSTSTHQKTKNHSLSLLKYFNKYDTQGKGSIHTKDFWTLLSSLGVKDFKEKTQDILKNNAFDRTDEISFVEFEQIWEKPIVYTIVSSHVCNEKGNERLPSSQTKQNKILYKGPSTSCKLRGLTSNTDYKLRVQCSTFISSSKFSTPLRIKTLPYQLQSLLIVDIDRASCTVLLKAIFSSQHPHLQNGCKLQLEKLEMKSDEEERDEGYTLAFKGKKHLIKATSILPGKAYKFRCAVLNETGENMQYVYSEMIQMKEGRKPLSNSSLPFLFDIDCTQDMLEGDLILYTEQKFLVTKAQSDFPPCLERSTVARIMSRTILENNVRLRLEVISRRGGKNFSQSDKVIIEKCELELKRFEVLRIPWVNELQRQ